MTPRRPASSDAGHIQAVGTDAAGRRQYLYHPLWRARRDEEKHERVLTMAGRCRGDAASGVTRLGPGTREKTTIS